MNTRLAALAATALLLLTACSGAPQSTSDVIAALHKAGLCETSKPALSGPQKGTETDCQPTSGDEVQVLSFAIKADRDEFADGLRHCAIGGSDGDYWLVRLPDGEPAGQNQRVLDVLGHPTEVRH